MWNRNVTFVWWLPFRRSSLCASSASSICALVCASFGELRSACPSTAHGLRSHLCKIIIIMIIIHKRTQRRGQVLWCSLRAKPLVFAGVFYAWTDCRRDYSLCPFPRRRGDRWRSPTDYLYPKEEWTQVRWETSRFAVLGGNVRQ